MFIALLTLLSALSISGVAIFYSVIGLAAIFPGAFVPIIVMGGVLEVGKLVTASWLYRNWKFTPFLLKSYLTVAIIVLSIITSMGIFGFLSKAHVEQNLTSETVIQRIQIINDKIDSERVYINRQKAIIERTENSLTRVGTSNTDDIEIEKLNIKNANEKLTILLAIESSSIKDSAENLKTLLVVETNTIKDLNVRLSILDEDVNALRDKKGLFSGGNHKKAMRLKEAQAPERDKINAEIRRVQGNIQKLKQSHQNNINQINERIAKLKKEHADEIAKAQANIEKMRGSVSTNKDDFETGIVTAENNIVNAQNNIDDLIIERQPLQATILKLETEVGPIKYIAALAVDWGFADEVNLSKAVRWVIIIIIFVFDPLAVLLLIAANQSLIRRFPPEKPAPPDEILDLERPDFDEPGPRSADPQEWNSMVQGATQAAQKEQLDKMTKRLQDWKGKLEAFNNKREKPENKPVEFIQEDETIPHVDLKGQKEIPDKEIVVDNTDGFNEDEIAYDIATPEQEPTISEKIEKVMEPERTRPDFTEVIEPEKTSDDHITVPEAQSPIYPEVKELEQFKPKEEKPKEEANPTTIESLNAKPNVLRTLKKDQPTEEDQHMPTPSEEQDKILKDFHAEHGEFEDITEDQLKQERDDANKAQFLADIGVTEEDAKNHPPMTASRKAFFQDHVDDILRGSTTIENLPPDIAKTVGVLLSDYDDPEIIHPGSALKEEDLTNVETMTTEGLKEKFQIEPDIEDRDISEVELDKLLDGFKDDEDPSNFKIVIKDGQKVKVPIEPEYKQNEEQKKSGNWTKILDIKEPEHNEIILPDLKPTDDVQNKEDEEIVDIQPVNTISPAKIDRYKKRMLSDIDYRAKIEARIDELITKIESKEITIDELTEQDRQVIIDIMNQNG